VQQFYHGELGDRESLDLSLIIKYIENFLLFVDLAMAEVIFEAVKLLVRYLVLDVEHPFILLLSGKLPVSFPRYVGTTSAFYNYLKGSRHIEAGQVLPNSQLIFGHQVCIPLSILNAMLTIFLM
jgi:hypothetical protein